MHTALAWTTTDSLLAALIAISLLIVFQLRAIRRGLARTNHPERAQASGPASGFVSASAAGEETGGPGSFDAFLAEDPARRELPKSEQFAAYRKWRKDMGLNWSNS